MLAQAFLRLGAQPRQADTMARQLLKRARQLAAKRHIDEALALEELLSKIVQGRLGTLKDELR
jgi:hypothetical protein